MDSQGFMKKDLEQVPVMEQPGMMEDMEQNQFAQAEREQMAASEQMQQEQLRMEQPRETEEQRIGAVFLAQKEQAKQILSNRVSFTNQTPLFKAQPPRHRAKTRDEKKKQKEQQQNAKKAMQKYHAQQKKVAMLQRQPDNGRRLLDARILLERLSLDNTVMAEVARTGQPFPEDRLAYERSQMDERIVEMTRQAEAEAQTEEDKAAFGKQLAVEQEIQSHDMRTLERMDPSGKFTQQRQIEQDLLSRQRMTASFRNFPRMQDNQKLTALAFSRNASPEAAASELTLLNSREDKDADSKNQLIQSYVEKFLAVEISADQLGEDYIAAHPYEAYQQSLYVTGYQNMEKAYPGEIGMMPRNMIALAKEKSKTLEKYPEYAANVLAKQGIILDRQMSADPVQIEGKISALGAQLKQDVAPVTERVRERNAAELEKQEKAQQAAIKKQQLIDKYKGYSEQELKDMIKETSKSGDYLTHVEIIHARSIIYAPKTEAQEAAEKLEQKRTLTKDEQKKAKERHKEALSMQQTYLKQQRKVAGMNRPDRLQTPKKRNALLEEQLQLIRDKYDLADKNERDVDRPVTPLPTAVMKQKISMQEEFLQQMQEHMQLPGMTGEEQGKLQNRMNQLVQNLADLNQMYQQELSKEQTDIQLFRKQHDEINDKADEISQLAHVYGEKNGNTYTGLQRVFSSLSNFSGSVAETEKDMKTIAEGKDEAAGLEVVRQMTQRVLDVKLNSSTLTEEYIRSHPLEAIRNGRCTTGSSDINSQTVTARLFRKLPLDMRREEMEKSDLIIRYVGISEPVLQKHGYLETNREEMNEDEIRMAEQQNIDKIKDTNQFYAEKLPAFEEKYGERETFEEKQQAELRVAEENELTRNSVGAYMDTLHLSEQDTDLNSIMSKMCEGFTCKVEQDMIRPLYTQDKMSYEEAQNKIHGIAGILSEKEKEGKDQIKQDELIRQKRVDTLESMARECISFDFSDSKMTPEYLVAHPLEMNQEINKVVGMQQLAEKYPEEMKLLPTQLQERLDKLLVHADTYAQDMRSALGIQNDTDLSYADSFAGS